MANKIERAKRRRIRVRSKVVGSKSRPRLTVHRSVKHIYAQLIDDEKGTTLAEASDLKLKKSKAAKAALAFEVGKALASAAKTKKVKKWFLIGEAIDITAE